MPNKKMFLQKMVVMPVMLLSVVWLYNISKNEDDKNDSVVNSIKQEVIIYTKAGCVFCTRAINLMRKEGIKYTEQDITYDSSKFESLKAITGIRTVPYIFIDHKYIGGYTDFSQLLQDGELKSLKQSK